MQFLILDFGNTFYKAAIFEQGNLVYKFSGKLLQRKDLISLKKEYPKLSKAIYSTVVDLDTKLIEFLHIELSGIELTAQTKIPIKNSYLTPETLGKDRLAAAIGASRMYPKKELLVIDAGSSITFDRITAKSEYLGGSISPGIAMRFKSLHQFTGKLPLVQTTDNQIDLIGRNTKESILSGVMLGVIAEVDGIIDKYKLDHPEILVLFTGGDLKHFDKNLKNNIFAAENLVLQGLNFILEYNDNKTI